MTIDEITSILGADIVQDMGDLVQRAHAIAGAAQDHRDAVVQLLFAMVAASMITRLDEDDFVSAVDRTVEELRSICVASHHLQHGQH